MYVLPRESTGCCRRAFFQASNPAWNLELHSSIGSTATRIRAGYQRFKDQKYAAEVAETAETYGLPRESLQTFVDNVLNRMIFDGEQLTELLAPLELGWRDRTEKELALMADLVPLLKRRAGGRDISGLKAYEE